MHGPDTKRSVVSEVSWKALATRPAQFKVAFRNEQFKYVATLEAPALQELDVDGIRREELYDLQAVPGETVNLASGSGEELRSFRKDLQAYLADARQLRSTRRGREVEVDDLLRERLEALGYVNN